MYIPSLCLLPQAQMEHVVTQKKVIQINTLYFKKLIIIVVIDLVHGFVVATLLCIVMIIDI